jgi:anti-anti-sigma factor
MIEKHDFYINGMLQEDVLFITITEENLIMNVAPGTDLAIQSHLKEKEYNFIVIDLSNVIRLDSSGYGVFMNMITYFPRAEKVNIFIINMRPIIKKLIDMIGFPLVLYTYPTLESATEKIRELKRGYMNDQA